MRLLVIVGNKVFVVNNKSAFLMHDKNNNEIFQWLKSWYSLDVLKSEEHPSYNVNVIYAVSCGNLSKGNLISIAAAIKRMGAEESELAKYLRALNAKLSIKLQYGIRDGKVICISEVPKEEHGLKCKCTCPGCGLPLQAKLGEKRQPHFAHNNTSCDIASAQQTALHMLAKEIIEEEMRILLPALTIERSDFDFSDEDHDFVYRLPPSITYLGHGVAKCSSVVLEKKISDIIPDIIVVVGGKTCLIEIAVTHFIDEEKLSKINEIGLAVMEIDLSEMYGVTADREAIRQAVLFNADNRRWVYNPRRDEALQWAEEKYRDKLAALQKKYEEEQEEYTRKVEAKNKRQQATKNNLRELFKSKNYREALNKYRNNQFANAIISECCFYKKERIAPFFVDIPITGEMIFQCDRRAWQSRIFDKFIYNRKGQRADVHIKKIEKWITKYQHEFKIDWTLASKADITINNHYRCVTLLYDVIKQYLLYMHELGFISELAYSGAFVEAARTISAPNSENAIRLQAVLKTVDLCDPDIDTLICHALHSEMNTCVYHEYENMNYVPQDPLIRAEISENERKLSFEQVKDLNYDGSEIIVDGCGKRWLLCTSCGRICREDEMAFYGGINTVNKGICKKCMEKENECKDLQ